MSTEPAPKATRDSLAEAITALQKKAMKPGIPIPQMVALKNRAQELFDQLIELDAAEFNASTSKYKSAIKDLNLRLSNLQNSIQRIDDAVRLLDDASKVFKSLDKLLKVAAKFGPMF